MCIVFNYSSVASSFDCCEYWIMSVSHFRRQTSQKLTFTENCQRYISGHLDCLLKSGGKNWSLEMFPVTASACSGLFGGHTVLITFTGSLPSSFYALEH